MRMIHAMDALALPLGMATKLVSNVKVSKIQIIDSDHPTPFISWNQYDTKNLICDVLNTLYSMVYYILYTVYKFK